MTTNRIGRIVVGSLTAGLVFALTLVVGPFAGAQEHVITGTVLLAFASSWALLATLSILGTSQPQRWAFVLAAFLGLAGAGLLAFAPSGSTIDALGWVWPPHLLALLAGTIVPAVDGVCAERFRRWLSNDPRVDRTPREYGARPVDRCRRTSASPELRGIRWPHRHPRIGPWRDCRLLGMDLGRSRTRH